MLILRRDTGDKRSLPQHNFHQIKEMQYNVTYLFKHLPSFEKGMKPNSSSTTRSSFVSGLMNFERRNPSFAASKSFTRPATPKNRTFLPCLHAAKARPVAICDFPYFGFPNVE